MMNPADFPQGRTVTFGLPYDGLVINRVLDHPTGDRTMGHGQWVAAISGREPPFDTVHEHDPYLWKNYAILSRAGAINVGEGPSLSDSWFLAGTPIETSSNACPTVFTAPSGRRWLVVIGSMQVSTDPVSFEARLFGDFNAEDGLYHQFTAANPIDQSPAFTRPGGTNMTLLLNHLSPKGDRMVLRGNHEHGVIYVIVDLSEYLDGEDVPRVSATMWVYKDWPDVRGELAVFEAVDESETWGLVAPSSEQTYEQTDCWIGEGPGGGTVTWFEWDWSMNYEPRQGFGTMRWTQGSQRAETTVEGRVINVFCDVDGSLVEISANYTAMNRRHWNAPIGTTGTIGGSNIGYKSGEVSCAGGYVGSDAQMFRELDNPQNDICTPAAIYVHQTGEFLSEAKITFLRNGAPFHEVRYYAQHEAEIERAVRFLQNHGGASSNFWLWSGSRFHVNEYLNHQWVRTVRYPGMIDSVEPDGNSAAFGGWSTTGIFNIGMSLPAFTLAADSYGWENPNQTNWELYFPLRRFTVSDDIWILPRITGNILMSTRQRVIVNGESEQTWEGPLFDHKGHVDDQYVQLGGAFDAGRKTRAAAHPVRNLIYRDTETTELTNRTGSASFV